MSAIPSLSELLLWLAILLGGAIAISSLIRKVSIPSVLGFILLGIAVGPYGFGFITNIELIDLFAELGIVILLFALGLEFSFEKLRSIGSTMLIVGLIEQSIMFLLGFSIGTLIGWSVLESLYLAGVLAISSTAVILKLLHDAGILHTREASTIIGTLILEDIAAVLILVLLGDIAQGGDTLDFMSIGIIIAQTLAFFIITLTIGLKVVPKIISYIDRLDIDEAPFLTALALGFGLAFLANYLGLSIAIGAFLMGMMISSAPKSESITHKVLPLRDFFGTIFFISIGMLIDITLFPEHILTAIPLIIIAVIGKFVGNYIGATIVGHDRAGASTIGSMMVPRGEFSFIIAKQGIDLGVAKAALLPLTMIVSLVTMIIVPLILRILPTIMDARTIFPSRVFAPLEFVGSLFRNLIFSQKYEDNELRRILPRVFANIAIIATILAALSILEEFLLILYDMFYALQIIPYDIFKLIIILAMIAYPIFNIFGKAGEITEYIFEAFQTKVVSSRMITGSMNYLHRIIRNIVTATAVLLISSFIIPSVSVTTGIELIVPISSIISLSIFVYLFIDTFFVIHKKLERGIISSLFGEEKEKK
jgi:CPA2 family monovalent cation:H+ antiporter-2